MKNILSSRTFRRAALSVLLIAFLVFGALMVGFHDQPAVQQTQDSAPAVMYAARNTSAETEEVMYDAGADMVMAGGMTTSSAKTAPQESRKIVRSADLTLSTAAFDATVEKVNAAVSAVDGYAEHLYQYGEPNARRLSLTLRVPSARLDEFLASVSGAGRVTHRSESTADLTTSYQDNEARLKTLYAKRDRLNVLLEKAEDVSDLIEIETAIADTQYQIDSYETSQRSIDRQVDMSTVSLTITEERPADSAQADVPMTQRIRAAFAASLEWTGEFLRDLVIFIVMILPVAVPLAAIALVIRIIRKKRKGN